MVPSQGQLNNAACLHRQSHVRFCFYLYIFITNASYFTGQVPPSYRQGTSPGVLRALEYPSMKQSEAAPATPTVKVQVYSDTEKLHLAMAILRNGASVVAGQLSDMENRRSDYMLSADMRSFVDQVITAHSVGNCLSAPPPS